MIIECEKCHTKFNLDENLLKKTGSKVRCSICRHVFTAFPMEAELQIEEISIETIEDTKPGPLAEMEAGAAQETEVKPPEGPAQEVAQGTDFDKTMIQEYDEEIEPISIEDLPIFDEDEDFEVEKEEKGETRTALGRAKQVEKQALAQDEFKKEGVVEEPRIPDRPQPVVKRKRRTGLRMALLLVLLVIAAAVGLSIKYKPDFLSDYVPFLKKTPPKKQAFDVGNKRLSFKDLSGSFVNSQKAGKIFVVKGWVTNKYPDNRSFIRIKSNILNSKRMAVSSRVVFAGHPLTDKELKSLSVEEIDKRLSNKLGKNKMNTNVLPNSSIPFVVVFSSLPEDMSEFTVEAISSSPAAK